MPGKYLKRQSLSVGILLFVVIILLFPTVPVQAITVDGGDGIWSDTFDDENSTVILNGNAVWQGTQGVDGTILLKSNNSALEYTFSKDSPNKAYWYQTFLRPNFSIAYSLMRLLGGKTAFDTIDKNKIKTNDTSYKTTPSKGILQNVAHQFRIKLTVPLEKITNLIVNWYGKADANANIQLYCLGKDNNKKSNILPRWQYLTSQKSNDDDVSLSYNLSIADITPTLDDDNYCDFLVFANFSRTLGTALTAYTLSTDFIKLQVMTTTGFTKENALVESKSSVDPINISHVSYYWDLLTWDDFQNAAAPIRYQVMFENSTNEFLVIDDKYLPGNEDGFTTSPVYLSTLSQFGYKFHNLKIRANLSTTNPFVSPKIFSWALTWQTNLERWQDSFNSTYRLDYQNGVNVDEDLGRVNISTISGDWPLFGQNPSNTRAFDGPGASQGSLYWYSEHHLDETIYDPVIAGESLYLCGVDSSDSTKIYRYRSIVVPDTKIGDEFTGSPTPYELDPWEIVVGAPAVTDKYVVVATGTTVHTSGDSPRNYVYVFEKNNPSVKKKFNFVDEDDVNELDISYWGSPVVVGNTIYLSGWDGRDYLHLNPIGMMVAFNINDGHIIWRRELPAWSFSTPAVSNGVVFIGCKNRNGDSFFALDAESGDLLWNKSLGGIGKSAPVVSNNTVYVISEEDVINVIPKGTKVTALDVNDGTTLWEHSNGIITTDIPGLLELTFSLADATPALYDNILYITSPQGNVIALNGLDGTVLWSHNIYIKSGHPLKPILTSSPAYAGGIVYAGTPDGFLYALDTTQDGKEFWPAPAQMHKDTETTVSVATSPIVSNGLVFVGADNGYFYSYGKYVSPKKELSGSMISMPIKLPPDRWWGKFYADYDKTQGNIVFSILSGSGDVTLQENMKNGSTITYGNRTFSSSICLRANLSAANLTVNPNIYRWYVTFVVDDKDPVFNKSSLQPINNGWFNKTTSKFPKFVIQVSDRRSGDTGLNVSSAKYTLGYIIENESKVGTYPATCSGVYGTTKIENVTADLAALSFYENITTLESLEFSIEDLAGHEVSTGEIDFKHDLQDPISFIVASSIKSRYNTSFTVSAITRDPGIRNVNASGIQSVTLYYRRSSTSDVSGPWTKYNTSTKASPTWTFSYSGDGGYFEFWTIAVDNATNKQAFPTEHSNISFMYDAKKPNLPEFSGETLWFHDRPNFTVDFSDDFLLDTIRYHINLNSTWTTLASHVNKSSFTAFWKLSESDWMQMQDGVTYNLFFWINDTLNNVQLVNDTTHAIHVRKDNQKPQVNIVLPDSGSFWTTSEPINITALVDDRNGSGIKYVRLYYRYSEDDSTWTDWEQYGTSLTAAPYIWQFIAPDGNGYYQFKIIAEDLAGNIAESAVASSGMNIFPGTLISIMAGLVVVLVIISSAIVIKWRKKKE